MSYTTNPENKKVTKICWEWLTLLLDLRTTKARGSRTFHLSHIKELRSEKMIFIKDEWWYFICYHFTSYDHRFAQLSSFYLRQPTLRLLHDTFDCYSLSLSLDSSLINCRLHFTLYHLSLVIALLHGRCLVSCDPRWRGFTVEKIRGCKWRRRKRKIGFHCWQFGNNKKWKIGFL